ncbi:MAG: multifunctional CCA addition/repair protein [Magnetococcus sp. WYHC-3]
MNVCEPFLQEFSAHRDLRRYRVGGAVRDLLLGLPPGDCDWVVVGSSPEELLQRGFIPVGGQFPVFLHPHTREEHALARQERKVAPGHRGFVASFTPATTLEEDLYRRDFTINAMALDDAHHLHDPWGGMADLRLRRLRHVSAAFAEDPLRVLRGARLLARLASLGFTLAEDTLALMSRISASGELATLAPERVWNETCRALSGPAPALYFRTLDLCGALPALFPELAVLRGIPQPLRYHPEGDVWTHTLLVLQRAAELETSPLVRFCALAHDLGKGTTPSELLPGHRGHEDRGVEIVAQLAARLRLPGQFLRTAQLTTQHHLMGHRLPWQRPGTVLKVLESLGALQDPARLEPLVLVCQADDEGRGSRPPSAAPHRAGLILRECLAAARRHGAADLLARRPQLAGADLGKALSQVRRQAIGRVLRRWQKDPAYSNMLN